MLWIMKVSNLFEKIFEIIFQWPYIKSVIRHQTNIICTWIYQHDQNIIIIMIMTPNNKLSYEEERSIYYDNIFLFSRKCHAIFHHRLTLWSFFFLKPPVLQLQQPTSHPAIFEKSQTKTIDFFRRFRCKQRKHTIYVCINSYE